MNLPFSWRCPFCERHATITESNYHISTHDADLGGVEGSVNARTKFIVCPNPKCGKSTFSVTLWRKTSPPAGGGWGGSDLLGSWRLIPESHARLLPEYIPQPIRDDYLEACRIRDLSPKASATLARRCLQGMIRDFWGVSKPRLIDEINAIKDKVDANVWDAIDTVRKVGNIGAHMEKDINLIIDVDPKEAQQLIGLIELLVDDWYVVRHDREQRLEAIKSIGETKDQVKANGSEQAEDEEN